MAGRGCSVKIQILRQEDGQDVFTDEINLPVALHSPLSVLKELLQDVAHIIVANQVLILCDLTDPDRNRDVHLDSSRDELTLFQCGVQQGSVLALHALGLNTASISRFDDLHKNRKEAAVNSDPRPIQTVSTAIKPDRANHSYNGIIFDVACKSPFEIDVVSVAVGGMLGRVRVFYKYGSWLDSDENERAEPQQQWWGASERVCAEGWAVAADIICTPSWDNAQEIPFRKPINMLPGQKIALYLHSGLPDDLGIQYQSYNKNSIVAEDEHIILYPGLGHTGSQPFDEVHGWYRAYRGLAGSLNYRCHRKGWNIWSHDKFPRHFRDCVFTILLCREHSLNVLYTRRRFLLNAYAATNSNSNNLPTEVATDRRRQLGLLHTHVLYYIMEFMHWDWFHDPNMEVDGESVPNPRSGRHAAAAALRHLMMRAAASGLDINSESVQEGIGRMYSSLLANMQNMVRGDSSDDDDNDGSNDDYDDEMEEDIEGDELDEEDIENSEEEDVESDESSDRYTGDVEASDDEESCSEGEIHRKYGTSESGSEMVTGSEGNADAMTDDSSEA